MDHLTNYSLKYANNFSNAKPLSRTTPNYPSTFDDAHNRQLSVIQEPNVAYQKVVKYMNIDSRHRDTVGYPHVNNYKINISPRLKNVSEVKLISVMLPNKNSVLNNGYLILKIEEIDGIDLTTPKPNRAFSILHLKPPTASNFIISELGCNLNTPSKFTQPKDISSLTIGFYTPTGSLFDFLDSSGNTDAEYQNSFILQFTQENVVSSIDARNVY